jgi:ATP-binding cassette subfamily B protein
LQLWLTGATNRFSTRLGTLFRQRLMFGTLQLHPDDIRHEGYGAFFERTMSADQIELLGLSGGLLAVLSGFQLIAAVAILSLGASGPLLSVLLVAFVAAAVAVAWNYSRADRAWNSSYDRLTNELVERMIGHRTRLAQQDPREWHVAEDDELEQYVMLSQNVDRSITVMDALPRLWVAAGIAGLLPAFLNASATPTSLAVSIGGILLAFGALTTIAAGFRSFVAVGKAWGQVKPLFDAATRHKPLSPVQLKQLSVEEASIRSSAEPVIRARNVSYRYTEHSRQVLTGIDCDIYAGDRILVEGPSGGGKTTLAAVLAGLRQPNAGQVLTRGFARASIENAVTPRRVVMAPQFHENYIFSATMAFNLLMGRRWPPTDSDIQEAHALCEELGLGELLERMPSGMSQMVGDNGWQLSHGERSRIYIARALLQKADLLILDESFGALDPENLQHALETTLRRAPTLMVIAHP